jgi:hypothetical protein
VGKKQPKSTLNFGVNAINVKAFVVFCFFALDPVSSLLSFHVSLGGRFGEELAFRKN